MSLTPRIDGIRRVKDANGQPTRRWAVVGSIPTPCSSYSGLGGQRRLVLVSEHDSKREAIEASGTNVVLP